MIEPHLVLTVDARLLLILVQIGYERRHGDGQPVYRMDDVQRRPERKAQLGTVAQVAVVEPNQGRVHDRARRAPDLEMRVDRELLDVFREDEVEAVERLQVRFQARAIHGA